MDILLLQSEFFGEEVKSITFFKKILEEMDVKWLHIHGEATRNINCLEDWLKNNKVRYILISAWCYNNAMLITMLDLIEKYSSESIVILGGWLPNLVDMQTFNLHKRIDYIALGDGEQMIRELAMGKDVKSIDGLYSRNSTKELIYMKCDRENEVMIEGNSVVPLSGCGSKCRFCSILKNKQNFWKKSLKRVEEEIIFQKSHNISQVYLGYDNVLMHRQDALKYASLMKKYGIVFATTGRADQIDEELVSILSDSGCARIDFGIESASERLSKYINKNLTKSMMYNSAALCRKYNIIPFGFLIVGLPTESSDDLNDTLEFIKNSQYLLFEINPYKDYVRSQFADEIKNFDLLATSKYYQYEICYGVYHDKKECLKVQADYLYTVNAATHYMIDKMFNFFDGNFTEYEYQAYWRSFRDATFNTDIIVDKARFKDKKLYDDFNYWWRIKQFDNLKKAYKKNILFTEKYFINKDILENEGRVVPEEVSPEDIKDYYYKQYGDF